MISKGFVQQPPAVVQAQLHLLDRLRRAVDGVSEVFSTEQLRRIDLAELEQLIVSLPS